MTGNDLRKMLIDRDMSQQDAANILNISVRTLQNWMKRDVLDDRFCVLIREKISQNVSGEIAFTLKEIGEVELKVIARLIQEKKIYQAEVVDALMELKEQLKRENEELRRENANLRQEVEKLKK